jgi:hypothetical protein
MGDGQKRQRRKNKPGTAEEPGRGICGAVHAVTRLGCVNKCLELVDGPGCSQIRDRVMVSGGGQRKPVLD